MADAEMQGDDPSALEALSRDRLDGYRTVAGDTDKSLIGRYLLNAAISEALHPLLHGLEVVLRNRIHAAASAKYPIDAAQRGTYNQFPCWLDVVKGPLTSAHQDTVKVARDKIYKDLKRRYGRASAAAARMHTPGRLVAALPFSFWVFLFDETYSGTRSAAGIFWPEMLADVFPHAKSPQIGIIRKRLRHMLVVRNRAMHYERLYPWEYGKGVPWDPVVIRRDILELLDWMHPRTAAFVEQFDRIPDVMDPAHRRLMQWFAWRY